MKYTVNSFQKQKSVQSFYSIELLFAVISFFCAWKVEVETRVKMSHSMNIGGKNAFPVQVFFKLSFKKSINMLQKDYIWSESQVHKLELQTQIDPFDSSIDFVCEFHFLLIQCHNSVPTKTDATVFQQKLHQCFMKIL